MFLIGLTGGIASGKSTVAKLLAAHGAHTIDADQVARDVVEIGSAGLALVVAEFGVEVLTDSGGLDRQKLGAMIFEDSEKRQKLEAILHPLIKKRSSQLMAESENAVVVYAVPLLVEAKVDYPFNLIVTVEAGVENQIERLVRSRGLSVGEARKRIDAQASAELRLARADFALDSSGTHEQLGKQVDALWLSIQSALKSESHN